MATKVLGPAIEPQPDNLEIEDSATSEKAIPWNLPANADSLEQREILDALPALVFLERDGMIVFANAEARQMLGCGDIAWGPRPIEEVFWGLFPGAAEPQTSLRGTKRGNPFHATLPVKNGRLLPVEGAYSVTNAALRESVIVAHPSGRERAPKTRLMEDVLSSIPEGVAIELGNRILYSNPAFSRIFGYSAEEAAGASLAKLIVPETRPAEHAALVKRVATCGRVLLETVRRNKAGELLHVHLQVAPLLVDGAQLGYVYTFRDASECREPQAPTDHDAMHDGLTGLPNRALFADRVGLALTRGARRTDRACAVIYLDMDLFEEINEALGHAAGDILLNSVAERLRGSLRPQDTAARLSSDTFAVLVEDLSSVTDLEGIAERISREMARPFDLFGHLIQSGASVGAAIAERRHTSADLLIRDAEQAMFKSKQPGGGHYEIFRRQVARAVHPKESRPV